MKQITEDYVSYEIAKLLKEKGFDIPCRQAYFNGSLVDYTMYGFCDGELLDCPSQSLALKWLREEKNYYIQIMLDSWALGGHLGYYIVIQDLNSDFEVISPEIGDVVFFNTYEEAVEAALNYVLKNLI